MSAMYTVRQTWAGDWTAADVACALAEGWMGRWDMGCYDVQERRTA